MSGTPVVDYSVSKPVVPRINSGGFGIGLIVSRSKVGVWSENS